MIGQLGFCIMTQWSLPVVVVGFLATARQAVTDAATALMGPSRRPQLPHKTGINVGVSYALTATLLCPGRLGRRPESGVRSHGVRATWIEGRYMSYLVDKHLAERANAVWLSLLWSALAACVVGALIFDLAYLFAR
jgi:hypothetical protein